MFPNAARARALRTTCWSPNPVTKCFLELRETIRWERTIMISFDFPGKTILITGALGAIAEHMVRRLAASGAMLVLTDIKEDDEARRTLNDWKIPASSY